MPVQYRCLSLKKKARQETTGFPNGLLSKPAMILSRALRMPVEFLWRCRPFREPISVLAGLAMLAPNPLFNELNHTVMHAELQCRFAVEAANQHLEHKRVYGVMKREHLLAIRLAEFDFWLSLRGQSMLGESFHDSSPWRALRPGGLQPCVHRASFALRCSWSA
jgi:hypothetical protein